jgi:hypothetical protein
VTAQHHIIRDTSASLARLLRGELERGGYPRIHIVDQAPKPDAIDGKLPAVSLYLHQLSLDPEGHDATPHAEVVAVGQPDGTVVEFLRRRRLWVRLDYLVSAWASTPDDEQLLLGLAIRAIMERTELTGDDLVGEAFEPDFQLAIVMSARLDDGALARFWSSLGQPIRPAIQVWTAVPILPEKLEELRRVRTRQVAVRPVEPGR